MNPVRGVGRSRSFYLYIFNMTTKEFIFEDDCYPQKLTNYINQILDDRATTASEKWYLICKAEYEIYSHKDSDVPFKGTPVNLSLETVPREFLLELMMKRRIYGYRELLDQFGFTLPIEYQ